MTDGLVLVQRHGRGRIHALDCVWVAGGGRLGEYVVRPLSSFAPDTPRCGCLLSPADPAVPAGTGMRDRRARGSFEQAVKQRDGFRCVECSGTNRIGARHIVPPYRGGTHEPSNGETLCRDHRRERERRPWGEVPGGGYRRYDE